MEPLFQVETQHTQETYRHMVSANYMRHQKNSTLPLYILVIILAAQVWYLSSGGNWLSLGAIGSGIAALAIGWLIVPLVDRVAARNVCRRLTKSTLKAAGKQHLVGIPVRYRFGDEGMESAGSEGTTVSGYDQVKDLVKTDRFYLVFLKNGQCLAVDKTHFALGGEGDFVPYLAARCQREWADFEVPKGRYE